MLQSFGPAGDHGDARSIFSQDIEGQQTPSQFDARVLYTLYRQKPGASPDQLRAAILASTALSD